MKKEVDKKNKKSAEKSKESENKKGLINSDIKKNVTAILLIVFSLLFLLSLINQAGVVGNYVNRGLGLILGWSKFLLPILLLVLGFVYFRRYDKYRYYLTTTGAIIFLVFSATILHSFYKLENMQEMAEMGDGGGMLGFGIAFILVKYMGLLAASVLSGGFLLIGLILTFNFPLNKIFRNFDVKFFNFISKIKSINLAKKSENSIKEEEQTNIKKIVLSFLKIKLNLMKKMMNQLSLRLDPQKKVKSKKRKRSKKLVVGSCPL